jgi:predicted branched-subunit amino acid permease
MHLLKKENDMVSKATPERRQELIAGLKAASPLLVAMVPIGVVFGAIAVSKGLSTLEACLMSLLVFAGG